MLSNKVYLIRRHEALFESFRESFSIKALVLAIVSLDRLLFEPISC